jgi:hypothetical protein
MANESLAEQMTPEQQEEFRKLLNADRPELQEDVWPEPQPIHATLLPVPALDLDIIPEPFTRWISDVSHRMQVPIDYVAVAAIAMTSSIIGAGCGIKPKRLDDWLVVPNLWGGIVGPPGVLKSPAMEEAMNPLIRLEADSWRTFEAEQAIRDAAHEAWEAGRAAIKSKMKIAAKDGIDLGDLTQQLAALAAPAAPVCRRFRSNDSTIEKLNEILSQNPRGILLLRDELAGLFASFEREGHESDRTFYLEGWNGTGSTITDRIARGTIRAERICLSVFGSIQPSKLLTYLYQSSRSTGNDGLVQRFQLFTYPDPLPDWRLIDELPDIAAKSRAFDIIQRLANMNFQLEGGAEFGEYDKIPHFRFDDAAQEVFYEWLTDLERDKLRGQDDESPIIVEHLSKFRSLMPSLALIFHLIDVAGGQTPAGPVAVRSATAAAAWCGYLEAHARRIYNLVLNVEMQAAAKLAEKVRNGSLESGFSTRDISRRGWALLDDREVVTKVCDVLIDAGWLREEPPTYSATGRPSLTKFTINPRCRNAS